MAILCVFLVNAEYSVNQIINIVIFTSFKLVEQGYNERIEVVLVDIVAGRIEC